MARSGRWLISYDGRIKVQWIDNKVGNYTFIYPLTNNSETPEAAADRFVRERNAQYVEMERREREQELATQTLQNKVNAVMTRIGLRILRADSPHQVGSQPLS